LIVTVAGWKTSWAGTKVAFGCTATPTSLLLQQGHDVEQLVYGRVRDRLAAAHHRRHAGVVSPLAPSKVGTIKRSDGTVQVAYKGKPLYLFSNEAIGKSVAAGGLTALGNGAGVKVGGGVFELVTP
jgi:Secreted repeat of unknown function